MCTVFGVKKVGNVEMQGKSDSSVGVERLTTELDCKDSRIEELIRRHDDLSPPDLLCGFDNPSISW